MESLPEYYTVAEVAGILRVTPATIRRRIRDKDIEGAFVPRGSKSYLIPAATVQHLAQKEYGK